MMWPEPQKVGVEDIWAANTTNTRPSPAASDAPKVAIRIPRGVRRPPLTRATQRPIAESGPRPGRPATSAAPRGPSLEAAQHQDGEQQVEPEEDEHEAPHPEVPELA